MQYKANSIPLHYTAEWNENQLYVSRNAKCYNSIEPLSAKSCIDKEFYFSLIPLWNEIERGYEVRSPIALSQVLHINMYTLLYSSYSSPAAN